MTLSNRSQNEDKSVKFDIDVNFIIEPSTVEKFIMHSWMLQCVLYKSSFDIEPLSSTLHGVNARFIHHLSNVENYSIGHKSETD